MKQVLEECVLNTATLKVLDMMRIILSNHDDFRTEKTIVENFLICQRHVHFIPKFHYEITPLSGVGDKENNRHVFTHFTLPGLLTNGAPYSLRELKFKVATSTFFGRSIIEKNRVSFCILQSHAEKKRVFHMFRYKKFQIQIIRELRFLFF